MLGSFQVLSTITERQDRCQIAQSYRLLRVFQCFWHLCCGYCFDFGEVGANNLVLESRFEYHKETG